MAELDRIARVNKQAWEKRVEDGCGYARPWLELDRATIDAYVKGEIDVMPEPYAYIYPRSVFEYTAGKDVLCLASGGGQQSVVFGLLGADVTVFDLTDGQLAMDRRAAEHHGYEIETVQGDMRDLSVFADDSFDLVYQAISLVFVADLRQVYREVARVLRAGGTYRVGHGNPATQGVEESSWNGSGYVISSAYKGGKSYDEDDGIEFRHLLSDIFNGLIEAGLVIEAVWEDPRHLHHTAGREPGSYEHMLTFVGQHFAVVAKKPNA
jgi:SAM-dependent methyltransferase